MEAIGKIIVKLPAQSGTSKNGNSWTKQEYVLETQENYPRKIFFSFFGDRAAQFPLEEGQVIKLSFDIDSHEYNGRWFTNINGWKAEPAPEAPLAAPAPVAPGYGAAPAPQTYAGAPAAPAPVAPVAPAADFGAPAGSDDLPF